MGLFTFIENETIIQILNKKRLSIVASETASGIHLRYRQWEVNPLKIGRSTHSGKHLY